MMIDLGPVEAQSERLWDFPPQVPGFTDCLPSDIAFARWSGPLGRSTVGACRRWRRVLRARTADAKR